MSPQERFAAAMTYQLSLALFLLLANNTFNVGSCSKIRCSDEEKHALLSFKDGLVDPENILSSWSTPYNSDQDQEEEDDCCKWMAVVCNNKTGHVVSIRLSYPDDQIPRPLTGNISHSLLNLMFLSHLDLSGNHFNGSRIPEFIGSMNKLEYLALSNTGLGGRIPVELANISTLRYLDLSFNNLGAEIPEQLGQLINIEQLILCNNQFNGTIPSTLGTLQSLKLLSLSNNNLVGSLPLSLGSLSDLETLAIDSNSGLSGVVSDNHFTNCSNLKILNATSSSLAFSFTSKWIPPFQLEYVGMGSCKVGPRFPAWLKSQTNVRYLIMLNSGIEYPVPAHWFWNWAAFVDNIDFTNNQLRGDLSNVFINSTVFKLSSNLFTGRIPNLSPRVKWLSVRNNSLTGLLSCFLCHTLHKKNNLKVLLAQQNQLSGELSDCWKYWRSLILLNLGWNQLSGVIPISLGTLNSLQALHLHRNNLSGEIPSSLRRLVSLRYINLQMNGFSGKIPEWIGEWTNMSVLNIRSNNFTGDIPLQVCYLSSTLVLDFAYNSLSGSIPDCLNNLSFLSRKGTPSHVGLEISITDSGQLLGIFVEYMELVIKGVMYLYNKTLKLVVTLDFSSNNISGSIPIQICNLKGLYFLNLSHNLLGGSIPEEIGNLKHLESLDLSWNQFSGNIPQSMSKLTSLSMLDLSYNNLQGEIPKGTQLQSFGKAGYVGNARLCGAPLTLSCGNEGRDTSTSISPTDDEDSDDLDMVWFYRGIGPGFATGFLVICCFLYVKVGIIAYVLSRVVSSLAARH